MPASLEAITVPVLTPVRFASVDAPALLELDVQHLEPLLHLERAADGAQGVVLVGGRHPEDGHDRVADELLDGAAVTLEGGAHLLEVAGDHLAERLGVEPLAERSRALEVGEDDRDLTPRLVHGRSRLLGALERRAAVAAEAELRRALGPAAWAGGHTESLGSRSAGLARPGPGSGRDQRCRAVRAELLGVHDEVVVASAARSSRRRSAGGRPRAPGRTRTAPWPPASRRRPRTPRTGQRAPRPAR